MYRSSNTPVTMLTTESNIIFPLDHGNKQFNSRLYTVALTDGKASNQEIGKVLADLIIAGQDPSNNLGWDRESRLAWVRFFVLTIVMTFGIILCSSVDESLSLTLLLIFLVCGCFWGCGNCLQMISTRTEPNKEIIRKKCQDVVDMHNKDYVLKGLRWHLPQEFPQWVELWKDYKLEAFSGEKRDVNLAENHGETEDVDLEKGSGKESAEDELEPGNENQRAKTWKDKKMYVALN